MASFTLNQHDDQRLCDFLATRGTTISEVARHAIGEYSDVPTVVQLGPGRTVRLDPDLDDRLAAMAKGAKGAKVSKSRALALLISRALDDLSRAPVKPKPVKRMSKAPGPKAFKAWTTLILSCADASGPGSKAWISATLDRVVQRLPRSVERGQIADIMVELNWRKLLVLSPCASPALFSSELIESSALKREPTTWHHIGPVSEPVKMTDSEGFE